MRLQPLVLDCQVVLELSKTDSFSSAFLFYFELAKAWNFTDAIKLLAQWEVGQKDNTWLKIKKFVTG